MMDNKLRQKGISAEIINNVLMNEDDDDDFYLCKKLIEKYAKSKDLSKEGSIQKMYASFARKGFSFEVIKRAAKDIINQNNEDFDFSD